MRSLLHGCSLVTFVLAGHAALAQPARPAPPATPRPPGTPATGTTADTGTPTTGAPTTGTPTGTPTTGTPTTDTPATGTGTPATGTGTPTTGTPTTAPGDTDKGDTDKGDPEEEDAPPNDSDDTVKGPPDDDEKPEKGKKAGKHGLGDITYAPRKGITFHAAKHTKLTVFMGAEVVALEDHCLGSAPACPTGDALSIHVRRARLAFEAKLKHHLRIDFGIQVKNEIIVLKNANFRWKHGDTWIKAGFLKPPGGMERDSSTWLKAFPERSVVANFKQDRILGLMLTQWVAHDKLRLQFAAGHPPSGNFDAFEPEDVVPPPPGIEPEDLTTDPGNWDLFATSAYAPSDNFELGLNTTAHIAPDAGQGPNFAEPYETHVITARFFKGAFLAGGADVVWHNDHVRASAEFVYFHSGTTIPHVDQMTGVPIESTRAERGEAGYFVVGWTPSGHYGKAIENAGLNDGWQIVGRGEFLSVSPGESVNGATTALFGSGTVGLEWQADKQLRLQVDCAVQHYNENAVDINHNAWRVYSEIWGQVLI